MQSGGLCIAGPGASLPRVSPRIRALQDRLMDSLPADGAWECLSPAQKNAILSLHAAKIAAAEDDSSETGTRKRLVGTTRFGRSRSYDDRLESETDDSGVRLSGSGANSHSNEDDSDPGGKRGGRFSKATSADRVTQRESKDNEVAGRGLKVTNGFGNVNKIISKQMSKGGQSVPSNVTLDCRNVQGEKRRRCRLDAAVYKEDKPAVANTRGNEGNKHGQGIGVSRKNILQKYEGNQKLRPVKEVTKHSPSSEEYDSGVTFKEDSLDEYIKERQNFGCEFDPDLDSLRMPRTDNNSLNRNKDLVHLENSKSINFEKSNFSWDRQNNKRDKSKSKEREIEVQKKSKNPTEPLKSNLKVNYSAKISSSFDYRTNMNKDPLAKYSNHWNNLILNNEIPIKPQNNPQMFSRESRFSKNANNLLNKSTGNLATKQVNPTKKSEITWLTNESKRPTEICNDKNLNRKYFRSKSLDRKYLEESTDEESDFETRRRHERVRRHIKTNAELDQERPKERTKQINKNYPDEVKFFDNSNFYKPKAKSAWDLTDQSGSNEYNEEFEIPSGFKSRSDMRSRWKNFSNTLPLNDKDFDNDEWEDNFQVSKWKRRSCDFELETKNEVYDVAQKKVDDFDRKRWYRRSCDLDRDFDFHYPKEQKQEKKGVAPSKIRVNSNDKKSLKYGEQYPIGNDVNEKRSKSRLMDDETYRIRMEEETMKRLEFERRLKQESEMMNKSKFLDDDFAKRYQHEHELGRRYTMENDQSRRYFDEYDSSRRARVEDYHRAKTSMGHYEREKPMMGLYERDKTSMGHYERDKRSKTPHAFKGKLQMIKQILFF